MISKMKIRALISRQIHIIRIMIIRMTKSAVMVSKNFALMEHEFQVILNWFVYCGLHTHLPLKKLLFSDGNSIFQVKSYSHDLTQLSKLLSMVRSLIENQSLFLEPYVSNLILVFVLFLVFPLCFWQLNTDNNFTYLELLTAAAH